MSADRQQMELVNRKSTYYENQRPILNKKKKKKETKICRSTTFPTSF